MPDLGIIFACFSRLAIELRSKIWKVAVTQLPRVLALHDSLTMRDLGDLGSAFTILQRSKLLKLAFLQANRESRRETIAMYELIFGT
jgi:hypothetical protein